MTITANPGLARKYIFQRNMKIRIALQVLYNVALIVDLEVDDVGTGTYIF
jgi:hypothetical protein